VKIPSRSGSEPRPITNEYAVLLYHYGTIISHISLTIIGKYCNIHRLLRGSGRWIVVPRATLYICVVKWLPQQGCGWGTDMLPLVGPLCPTNRQTLQVVRYIVPRYTWSRVRLRSDNYQSGARRHAIWCRPLIPPAWYGSKRALHLMSLLYHSPQTPLPSQVAQYRNYGFPSITPRGVLGTSIFVLLFFYLLKHVLSGFRRPDFPVVPASLTDYRSAMVEGTRKVCVCSLLLDIH
jgi:hypothetical protein